MRDISKTAEKVVKLINDYLRDYNVSQTALAEEIGVSRDTIGLWKQGKHKPQEKNLKLLEDFFEVDLSSTYALYKGDRLLAMGTLEEIAQTTGKKENYLKWRYMLRNHPSMLNRKRHNSFHLIKIDEDD